MNATVKFNGADWPENQLPWSLPTVGVAIKRIVAEWDGSDVDGVVRQVMKTLNSFGYDSVDRELAFCLLRDKSGRPYDDFYNSWLYAA